ncbi:hypothetical protein Xen7305DRAFT_00009010 [Xenococcus sp. PCC 7305]|uniref:hypothetical protein n=1 Tax=Xenococcus sp. PCC 7305 TaxID=102125 RepID=UPI0002ABFF6C|nr:hypothetical protein [Xenococcus sp. PCC 7305]ELS01199.1 hypothetical protein Xen7305DRAFT_00009010 [Xenococcus sp. PCC 7305]
MTAQAGAYFKKLVALMATKLFVPAPGTTQAEVLGHLGDIEKAKQTLKNAVNLANEAVDAVIAAPDNPYGADREAIAKAIVEKANSQKKP